MRGRGVERGKAWRDQGASDLTKAPAGRARGREPAAATWSRACGRVGLPTATAANTSTRARNAALSRHAGTGSGSHLVGPEVAFAPVPPAVRAGGSGRNRSLGTWVPAWCERVPPRVLSGVSPEVRAAGQGVLSPKYHAEKAWVRMASWFLTIHYVTPRL